MNAPAAAEPPVCEPAARGSPAKKRPLSVSLFAAAALLAPLFVYGYFFLGEVVAGRDVFRIAIPHGFLILESFREGVWPLWNPYNRLGEPLAATLQAQAFYPLRLLSLVIAGHVRAPTLLHLFHVYVLGIGAYAACRVAGVRRLFSIGCGLALGLGPLFANLAFLPNLAGAFAWSGFLLAATLRFRRAPSLRGVSLLSGPIALSLLCGAPEVTLFQCLTVLILLVDRHATSRRILLASIAAVLAFSLAAIVLIPGLEFASISDRGESGEQLIWSNDLADVIGLFALGGSRPGGSYWENQNLIHSFFIGWLGAVLGVVGLFFRRGARRLLVFALLCATLSLGASFTPAAWLIDHSPLAWFRYPTKFLLLPAFLLTFGAALGLERVAAWSRARAASRQVAAGLSLLAALILLMGAFPVSKSGNASLGVGLAISAAVALATAALISRTSEAQLPTTMLILWVAELTLGCVLTDYQGRRTAKDLETGGELHPELQRASRVSVEKTLEDSVVDPTVHREFISKSREGLIPMRNAEEHVRAFEGAGAPVLIFFAGTHGEETEALYSRLAVSHLLRFGDEVPGGVERVRAGEGGAASLYRLNSAWPRAFVSHEVTPAAPLAALEALRAPLNSGRFAVTVPEGASVETVSCEGSHARIVDEGLQHVELEVSACGPGLAVLSDTHFPGWRATLDGVEVPILRTNFLVRGVEVPGGTHRLEFRYAPESFTWGSRITLLALLLSGLFWALGKRSGSPWLAALERQPGDPLT